MGSHPDARVAARSRLLRFDADDSATYAYPELRAFEECNEGEENKSDGTNGSSSLFSKGPHASSPAGGGSSRRRPLHSRRRRTCRRLPSAPRPSRRVRPPMARRSIAKSVVSASNRSRARFLPRVTHVRLGGADDPSPVDARLVEELESEFAPGAYEGFVEFCARGRGRNRSRGAALDDVEDM